MFLPYTKTIKKREVLLMTLQKQILQKNAVGTAALACPSPYKTAWQRLKKQLTVPLLAALLVCGYNLLLGTPKAQAAEHKEKEPVVSRGPDEPGFRRYSKGFHHRNHHCGDDTGGKAYIIKRIALMGIVDMGSQRRQHKADGDPHQDA